MKLKPDIEATFEFIGIRRYNVYEGYRPAHLISEDCLITGVHHYYNVQEEEEEKISGTITFVSLEEYPKCLYIGKSITMYEGERVVGYATITKIMNSLLCK